MALVQRRIPATTDGEHDVGLQVAQTYLHSLGVTAWQDAILGAYAGNGDPASAYLRAVEAGALTARVRRRAVVGARPRPRAGRRSWSSGGRGSPAAGSGRHGQGHAGRRRGELHRRAVAALPRRLRRPRPATPGCRSSTRRCCASAVTRLDAEGFQVHVHAIGDRAVARGARRVRGRPRRQRPRPRGRHHVAHLQVVRARRPAAVRRARRDRQHAGAVGGPRRRDDRDDAAVPRRGAGRLAVPVRLARRRRGAARGRQRLAGQHPRPARRDPRRGQPRSTPTSRGRAVPAGARR